MSWNKSVKKILHFENPLKLILRFGWFCKIVQCTEMFKLVRVPQKVGKKWKRLGNTYFKSHFNQILKAGWWWKKIKCLPIFPLLDVGVSGYESNKSQFVSLGTKIVSTLLSFFSFSFLSHSTTWSSLVKVKFSSVQIDHFCVPVIATC